MLFGMLDLPMPISKNAYTMHILHIEKFAKLHAEDSTRAKREVRRHYGAQGDDVVNVLVSCDGTWQKRGFSSFLGLCLSLSSRLEK